MEDNIKSKIKSFIINSYNIEEKYFEISLKNLGGLSNKNFIVTITNKTTKEIIDQILYRKFGEISDVVERDLETMIINQLSEIGIAPKIYEIDPNGNFRIEQYLSNTSPIKKIEEFDNHIINQIIHILNNFSLIANVYKYEILNNKIVHNPIFQNDEEDKKIKKISTDMFNKCMNEMYNKALKNFKIFSEEFIKTIPRENNKELYLDFEKFDYYMKNYHNIFLDIFPKNGYMILCHNDIHRLNLIIRQNDKKIFLLDYEYACLNLIGNDFANYMNESCYIYENNYQFTKEKIDFEKYYNLYKLYINEFINTHKFMNNIEECKLFLNEIQTKKYYLKLHCVINLFWFLYCVIYLDFEELNKDKKNFFYFIHGIHRMYHFESAKNEINNIN
jgi:thiamine kinase-like enzyme